MNTLLRGLLAIIVGGIIAGVFVALLLGLGYLSVTVFGPMMPSRETPPEFSFSILLFLLQGIATLVISSMLVSICYHIGQPVLRKR